ncbi:MAG: hypothetical protein WAV40_01610 [Microgenomates group bacterium]
MKFVDRWFGKRHDQADSSVKAKPGLIQPPARQYNTFMPGGDPGVNDFYGRSEDVQFDKVGERQKAQIAEFGFKEDTDGSYVCKTPDQWATMDYIISRYRDPYGVETIALALQQFPSFDYGWGDRIKKIGTQQAHKALEMFLSKYDGQNKEEALKDVIKQLDRKRFLDMERKDKLDKYRDYMEKFGASAAFNSKRGIVLSTYLDRNPSLSARQIEEFIERLSENA